MDKDEKTRLERLERVRLQTKVAKKLREQALDKDAREYVGDAMQEFTELTYKIKCLERYVYLKEFDDLPEIDKSDLKEQLEAMRSYYYVLMRRVSRMCNNA